MRVYVLRSTIVAVCLGLLAIAWVGLASRSKAQAGGEQDSSGTEGAADAPVEAQPVLPALRAADAAFDQPFTANFEITVPRSFLGPELGRHTDVCRFTASADGVRGMSVETLYEHDPAFRPLGTRRYASIDYDDDGNLIVWRTLRSFLLSTPDLNQTLTDHEFLLVSPRGAIAKRSVCLICYKYKVGDRANLFQSHQFVLASGRGFSDRLERVLEERHREDGLVELTAAGCANSHWPSQIGEWSLLVAPENGHLVRSAGFTFEGHDVPAMEVHTNGLLERDGVRLAESATIKWPGGVRGPESDFVWDVTVRDFSRQADTDLLAELHQRVTAPLPDDATIVDYSRPTHVMYQVGEGPPDD